MSVSNEILELIHADLDGLASPAELARLKAAIAGDPEVREEYRRMRGLSDTLAQVRREQPPAGLAASVMRTIRRPATRDRKSIVDRFRSAWPGGRIALRYAYVLAAGAALGIVGMQALSAGTPFGPAVPERAVSGTLAPESAGRLDLTAAGVPAELVLRHDPAGDPDRIEVWVVKGGQSQSVGSVRVPRRQ